MSNVSSPNERNPAQTPIYVRQFFPLLLLLLISCSGCETDLTTGDSPAETPEVVVDAPSPTVTALGQAALKLVNEVRQSGCRCGGELMPPVAPLSLHASLTTAARGHSSDQAHLGSMQHAGSDGSNVGIRVTRAGYSWRGVAENVAWNYPTIEAVMEGWLASSGHCKNIMNATFTHMGIGVDNRYWTQVFARQ